MFKYLRKATKEVQNINISESEVYSESLTRWLVGVSAGTKTFPVQMSFLGQKTKSNHYISKTRSLWNIYSKIIWIPCLPKINAMVSVTAKQEM